MRRPSFGALIGIISGLVTLAVAVSLFLGTDTADSQADAIVLPGDLPRPLLDSDFLNFGDAGAMKVRLGQLLFFDKVLSGNRNISCATCHHPSAHTGDALSLSVGEGGHGLARNRQTGDGDTAIRRRVGRNAPALFNLGTALTSRLFHDGRVALAPDLPSGFLSPAGTALPPGLDSLLAVQAMFPVSSPDEMAGHPGENVIADRAADERFAGIWSLIAERLRDIPAYVDLFRAAYPDVETARDITYVHAANAIGTFQAIAFRADGTPFDRWLRGDAFALDERQERGLWLFYGKAGCSACHSGPLLSDGEFHAIAMPQIGPGKGDGVNGLEDFGRERLTGDAADRYRFRTPPLRNVALTGPWGHSGAYATLEAVIRHHLDPVAALDAYDLSQTILPSRPDLDAIDPLCLEDENARADLAAANELAPVVLDDGEIADLVAFLHALTDPASVDLSTFVPDRVPSGLPVGD